MHLSEQLEYLEYRQEASSAKALPQYASLAHFAVMCTRRFWLAAFLAISHLPALRCMLALTVFGISTPYLAGRPDNVPIVAGIPLHLLTWRLFMCDTIFS